jgi:hypothetical protein
MCATRATAACDEKTHAMKKRNVLRHSPGNMYLIMVTATALEQKIEVCVPPSDGFKTSLHGNGVTY